MPRPSTTPPSGRIQLRRAGEPAIMSSETSEGDAMTTYQFTVVVERDEDGVYIASCPALAGCHAQGLTHDEAIANLKDAMRLHLEARRQLGEPIPTEVATERVEIGV